MNFSRVVALYGFAWLAGAVMLTSLHVAFSERPPAANLHKTGVDDDAPKVTPPILPGGLPSRLISTLPSGSELTATDVRNWNQNVAIYTSKDNFSEARHQESTIIDSYKLPSLGQKQSYDNTFLSSVHSLPIMSMSGKIIGVLGSKELKEFGDEKAVLSVPTYSFDLVGDKYDTSSPNQYDTLSPKWSSTFVAKDSLLHMKLIEYTWSKADPKAPSGVSTVKQYFLLDTTK